MAFLFVLDTPKCKCAKAQGSRQTVSSELTPREFHPNWRSARAALIACGGLDTARTVTGREYHYALCGLWRNRGLPDIWSQYRFAHHLSSLFACRQVLAYCSARLCSSQSQRECIWRMGIRFSKNNPVFATQRKTGREVLSSHPVARGKVLFWTLSQKFFDFLF